MNIYEELRKKRPAHPVMGPEFRSGTTSNSRNEIIEQNENAQPNQQTKSISNNTTYIQASSSFVTGPPTKNHWKPDSEVSYCSDCRRAFNIINRRHHCRKCGDIFCGQCTNYTARLDQDCHFNPKGVISRVCRLCHDDYQSRIILLVKNSEPARYKQKRSENTPGIRRETHNYYNPDSENIPIIKPPPVVDAPPATLMSVPNDWAWSTF